MAPPQLVFALLILILGLGGCREKTPVLTTRFLAFESQVDVSPVGVSREDARRATALIEEDFVYLERDWHAWAPGPMGRVNQLLVTGEPFVASPSILPLVQLSKTFEIESGGLFNPAIGALMDLWGFHDEPVRSRPPPTAARIAKLVAARPSMAQIDLDGLELRGRNPALRLDFSAIAKSRAIDLSIHHLRDMGIRNALIQAGEELRVIGDRGGQPWRIPIRRSSGAGVLAILPMRGDESMVTTADHDRNFIFQGTLYHDILDPRTGRPATRSRSVTVVHEEAARAAAAANAIFIAGPDGWFDVARGMGVRYALLVDDQGRVHMNPAMAARLELVDDNEPIELSEPLFEPTPAATLPLPKVPLAARTDP